MEKTFIYPYKAGSKSALALSEALGVKRIKLKNSRFKGGSNKMVINWGSSTMTEETKACLVVNRPENVAIAANKLNFFNQVSSDVNIPPYTVDKDEAASYVEAGKIVVARTTLTGHSGQGIHLLENMEEFEGFDHQDVKIYTQYIPKKDEFRVHVMDGEVLDYRRKSLPKGYQTSDTGWKVRTHQHGFIYAKEGFDIPEEVLEQARMAVSSCGLIFGAVDVIWNNFHKKAYVLEVNTAPGLEGSTLDRYKEGFEKFYEKYAPSPKPAWPSAVEPLPLSF